MVVSGFDVKYLHEGELLSLMQLDSVLDNTD